MRPSCKFPTEITKDTADESLLHAVFPQATNQDCHILLHHSYEKLQLHLKRHS